jgi:hypothetical protein
MLLRKASLPDVVEEYEDEDEDDLRQNIEPTSVLFCSE